MELRCCRLRNCVDGKGGQNNHASTRIPEQQRCHFPARHVCMSGDLACLDVTCRGKQMTLMARQLGCHSVMDRASYTMMRTRSAQQFPFYFVRKTPNNFFDVRLCESPCDCIVSVSLNKRTSQTSSEQTVRGSGRAAPDVRLRLGTNHTRRRRETAGTRGRRRGLGVGGNLRHSAGGWRPGRPWQSALSH